MQRNTYIMQFLFYLPIFTRQFRIRRKQCVSQSRFERESFGQPFTNGQSKRNRLMVLNVDHLFCLTQIRHSIFKNQCLIVRYLHQTVGNRKHTHTRHISMRANTDFCGCSARISDRESHGPCSFLRCSFFCRNMQLVSAGRATRPVVRPFGIL